MFGRSPLRHNEPRLFSTPRIAHKNPALLWALFRSLHSGEYKSRGFFFFNEPEVYRRARDLSNYSLQRIPAGEKPPPGEWGALTPRVSAARWYIASWSRFPAGSFQKEHIVIPSRKRNKDGIQAALATSGRKFGYFPMVMGTGVRFIELDGYFVMNTVFS